MRPVLSLGMSSHQARIIEQFTQQAVPFSLAPGIKNEESLELLVTSSGVGGEDLVLDVACGPGLVVGAFARVARQATGIDVTPAMIARARELNAGLGNVAFDVGDVLALPYPAASFSMVVSRFAFHHFEQPARVLAEMQRVCKPGGRIVVCDLLASDDPRKAAAFHAMEMMRDPSHARALRLDELAALFVDAGLPPAEPVFYRLAFELEAMLGRSFPRAEHVPAIRAAFEASVADDGLGLDTRRAGADIHGAYRVAILSARR
jgi:SAM-dependent methyltransferase